MLEDIETLFMNIELNWCDNPGKEIQNSENYKKLLSIFPNLQRTTQEGMNLENFEFNRTMRHIFRCFKVYYLLKQRAFRYESLSQDFIQKIAEKIAPFSKYVPLILMYHDIGRFSDRKTHAYRSSELIQKEGLFDAFDLSEVEKLLVRKVIEYHLLLATIYTGESTFFGIVTLINDPDFIALISNPDTNYADIFVDLLEVFTYLDVLGYPYAKIFDHYLNYYAEINKKLKDLLAFWPNLDAIVSQARIYSLEWTEWRLAGALRIYQFIGTEPHLTKEFHFAVLRTSLQLDCEKRGQQFDWDHIKRNYLSNIYKFQLKYALPFLILLAYGEFKRASLKANQTISSKLLLFWILLSKEVKKRNLDEMDRVWNIYFEDLPFWTDITPQFVESLTLNKLKDVVNNALLEFDEKRQEYNLHLDFK